MSATPLRSSVAVSVTKTGDTNHPPVPTVPSIVATLTGSVLSTIAWRDALPVSPAESRTWSRIVKFPSSGYGWDDDLLVDQPVSQPPSPSQSQQTSRAAVVS